jgi:hypothetical protein
MMSRQYLRGGPRAPRRRRNVLPESGQDMKAVMDAMRRFNVAAAID